MARTRALALILALVAITVGAEPAAAQQERPNVVVVMTDDQRLWDMEAMPQTNRLLGDEGTTFANSFATYPLCCPSRATFLSGQYAHNHGVMDNDAPEGGYAKFDFTTGLGVWLQNAGYRTAHIGKMLNEYGQLTSPEQEQIPPGYDDWFAMRDPLTYSMYNYAVQDNDQRRLFGLAPGDYQTDVIMDRAVEDIRSWAPGDQPFFMQVATSAVHWELYDAEAGPRPAPRHAGSYADHPFHPRPSYNEEDLSDKPSVMRHYGPIDDALRAKIAASHRTRLEALQAVDEGVGRIVAELEAAGELDDTLLVFTSDNGYLHGEHRFPSEKVVPYEESVRVPLLVRGPGFPAGETRRQLVGNIDLAPTIAAAAGATPLRVVDGEPLQPFARSPRHRASRSLLLEADFPDVEAEHALVVPTYHEGVNVFYDSVRTPRWKYVHWFRDVNGNPADEYELYDLAADPYEMQSLHESPRHAAIMRRLAARLEPLAACVGAGCRERAADPRIPCLDAPLRVLRGAVGDLRPGAASAEVLTSAGSPRDAGKRAWRYCVRGGGIARVRFGADGVARVATTTAPTRGTRGIQVGDPVADLMRAFPKARAIAPHLVAAGGGLRFGTDAGAVAFVAVGNLNGV